VQFNGLGVPTPGFPPLSSWQPRCCSPWRRGSRAASAPQSRSGGSGRSPPPSAGRPGRPRRCPAGSCKRPQQEGTSLTRSSAWSGGRHRDKRPAGKECPARRGQRGRPELLAVAPPGCRGLSARQTERARERGSENRECRGRGQGKGTGKGRAAGGVVAAEPASRPWSAQLEPGKCMKSGAGARWRRESSGELRQ